MGNFTLPNLPYAFDALEPFIDARTMEIHHDKHHNGYTNNLNAALNEDGSNLSIEKILSNISNYSTAVRNNGGGYYNHALFWTIMGKGKGKEPANDLSAAINTAFGSFEEFKNAFSNAAKTRFGSGWAWLILNDGRLQITSTPNQDNPLMDITEKKGTPILGLDVWEHAYYLKYQNRRPEYVEAFFHVINWDEVARRYDEAK